MLKNIRDSLHRQKEGLGVLIGLLREEFAELSGGSPKAVGQVELAVQELMRQLTAERLALRTAVQSVSPNRTRLSEILPALPAEAAGPLADLLREIDDREQVCAKQADKNYRLALALLDQSKSLLDFIQREISPPNQNVYSPKGRYGQPRPEAALLRGRL
jgi:hypothetical protein